MLCQAGVQKLAGQAYQYHLCLLIGRDNVLLLSTRLDPVKCLEC